MFVILSNRDSSLKSRRYVARSRVFSGQDNLKQILSCIIYIRMTSFFVFYILRCNVAISVNLTRELSKCTRLKFELYETTQKISWFLVPTRCLMSSKIMWIAKISHHKCLTKWFYRGGGGGGGGGGGAFKICNDSSRLAYCLEPCFQIIKYNCYLRYQGWNLSMFIVHL